MAKKMAKKISHAGAVFLSLWLAGLALMSPAHASRLEALVPNAKLVGEATFSVMFFDIYEAALLAPNGVYDRKGPFALQITYLVDADSERIISQSVKELKRQKAGSAAQIKKWQALMEKHFVDLKENDTANMIFNDRGTLTIWNNDGPAVEIDDRRFARVFMNIWLGKRARDKEFQAELMGRDS